MNGFSQLSFISPEIAVALSGLLLLLIGASADKNAPWLSWLAGFGVLFAAWFNFDLAVSSRPVLNGLVVVDHGAQFANGIFLGVLFLLILGSEGYLRKKNVPATEFYSMLMFATVGLMAISSAANLMVLFVGIELLSIALYALTGLIREDDASSEAALKYFITGAFATGFLLFGISFLYGATGTLSLQELYIALGNQSSSAIMPLVGMLFLMVGFGFKLAAVPFHAWSPDVYDGAPTLVTAFMATAVKAGVLIAFLRVFIGGLETMSVVWVQVLIWLAILSMAVGNLTALKQTSMKRLLAWSAIAHAGYLLIGLLVAPDSVAQGQPVFFYLVPYALMNCGAFLLAIYLEDGSGSYDLQQYKGLVSNHPFAALLMTIFMLALAGIPPTAGFIGKFYIFNAAVETGHIPLTIVAVLFALISVFYYTRVVVYMYFNTGVERSIKLPAGVTVAVTLAALVVLLLGILPGLLLRYTGMVTL
jgi:NADH-quinone oxidoreductase subunit N